MHKIAAEMPAEKYSYKPTPEMSTFSDQLVHVATLVQRFVDTSKGVKTDAAHQHAMAKPESSAIASSSRRAARG